MNDCPNMLSISLNRSMGIRHCCVLNDASGPVGPQPTKALPSPSTAKFSFVFLF